MKVGMCFPFEIGLDAIKTELKEQGADFWEGGYSKLAKLPEAEFDKIIDFIKSIGLPLTHCNGFIADNFFDSPEMRQQGKEYVKRSFERFSKTDLRHITFGSGGARATNENRDKVETKKILTEFCGEFLAPLAKDYGYTIGMEPLNSGETDVFTTTTETFEFVKSINLPEIRMIVDFSHFNKEKEHVSVLKNYKGYISHIHIADTNRRSPKPEIPEEKALYDEFWSELIPIADDNVCISMECWSDKPHGETFDYLREVIKTYNW